MTERQIAVVRVTRNSAKTKWCIYMPRDGGTISTHLMIGKDRRLDLFFQRAIRGDNDDIELNA